MKKKKYRLRYNRVIICLLIIVIFSMLVYFGFIKDYEKERLIKVGYSKEEITLVRDNLSNKEIKELLNYKYLSYLNELLSSKNKISENIFEYINYINKISDSYKVEDVIYLVNNDIEYYYSEKLSNIINSKYYIKSRLDRYMSYNEENIEDIIRNINSNLDYDFYTNIKKTDTSKGILMLVNKYYQLESNYSYGNLVTLDSKYDNKEGSKLNEEAYNAFKRLVDDAEKEGYYIRSNSAYRSYSTQKNLYDNYKSSNGLTWADKWSARPGHSEHQTGLALDVGVKNDAVLGNFESSKEFTWMKSNAYKYGFILRYPDDKQYITGYGYEPWHYRYVGDYAAKIIYDEKLTYEEYYAYYIEK